MRKTKSYRFSVECWKFLRTIIGKYVCKRAMTEADCLKWLQNCGEHRRHTRTPEKGQTNSILHANTPPLALQMAEGGCVEMSEQQRQQQKTSYNRQIVLQSISFVNNHLTKSMRVRVRPSPYHECKAKQITSQYFIEKIRYEICHLLIFTLLFSVLCCSQRLNVSLHNSSGT